MASPDTAIYLPTCLFPRVAGTPQGGVISPLWANLALHGLETVISEKFPKRRGFNPPLVRRCVGSGSPDSAKTRRNVRPPQLATAPSPLPRQQDGARKRTACGVCVTNTRSSRSRVSWKLSRTVLKPSRSGDAPAQGNQPSQGAPIVGRQLYRQGSSRKPRSTFLKRARSCSCLDSSVASRAV